MSVSPQTALLDEPVAVSVRGLPTGARTTVTATATDAGGITWSASAQFQATSAYDVDLQATVGDRVAAGATVRRQGPAAVGVVEKELRPASGGIYGNLYLPKTTATRRPGVLVFGGSDGGLSTSFAAALLAAHGYPSLALAYFKAPGLPRGLNNVPLEYFPKRLRCCVRSLGWIPAMCWSWACRGAVKPPCCSARTSLGWSTASSLASPARW
jgi:hypothetical protein